MTHDMVQKGFKELGTRLGHLTGTLPAQVEVSSGGSWLGSSRYSDASVGTIPKERGEGSSVSESMDFTWTDSANMTLR